MQEIKEFLNKMTHIQNHILELVDENGIDESRYNKFYQLIENTKIAQRKNEFKSFLHLLAKISEHHQRTSFIFPKIERILLHYKEEILRYFSNNEIFSIFKSNKRCILFLFQEKMIFPNRYILAKFQKKENKNYLAYCYQEIKDFNCDFDSNAYCIKYKIFSNMPDDKRKIGEDDSVICELIRNDSLDDFIEYVNHHKIDFSAKINSNVYESNSFLLKNGYNLIEYAAFSGSIKIFKYLYANKVDFDQTIWMYAIHSRNSEIIHIIEDINFSNDDINFNAIYVESIKCFYKEISTYLEENYGQFIKIDFRQILKTYNFEYFTTNFFNELDFFYELCHYDYITIVEILLQTTKPDFKSSNNKKALNISTEKSNIEIMNLLLNREEFDINSEYLLTHEIINENIETIQILLSHDNIKINSIHHYTFNHIVKVRETNLITAIKKGNPEIVKMLLNCKKIDVNTVSIMNSEIYCSETECPALFIAIEKGNKEIIKLLLDRKDIKVNIPSKTIYYDSMYIEITKIEKKTVLNIAIEQNSTEIVKLLLNSGKFNVNQESTIDTFEYDSFKYGLNIMFMNCIVMPILEFFFNNIWLTTLLSIIINHIRVISISFYMQFQILFH